MREELNSSSSSSSCRMCLSGSGSDSSRVEAFLSVVVMRYRGSHSNGREYRCLVIVVLLYTCSSVVVIVRIM